MARAYVKLSEVVDAFCANGSEPPGYVWRALAEHADSNVMVWRRGYYGILEGDNGATTFPAGTFVDFDGGTLEPSVVAATIRNERIEDGVAPPPTGPDDVTLSSVLVHVGNFAKWCQSVDVVCPTLIGAKGNGKHRGPQRLGLPPAPDVQSDEDGLVAPVSGSGSERWLRDVVSALLAIKPRPTRDLLVAAVLALVDKKVKLSARRVLAMRTELAPPDAKAAGRPPAETEAP